MALVKLQGPEEQLNGVFYEYDNESTPLGEGAMGRVFKGVRVVESTKEKIPVAIKCIFPNIPEHVIERARREASVRIDNPNLLRMYGFVEIITSTVVNNTIQNAKSYYVIMELLDGVTLYELMQGKVTDASGYNVIALQEKHNNFVRNKANAIKDYLINILNGLSALHEAGYLHRDIDPSNIMVNRDGNIKLIDFGICKKQSTLNTQDKGLTAMGVFMGKVNYASPELVVGDVLHQNATTDIYAVGVLLFQLCTGHLPFSGADNEVLAAHMRQPLPVKESDIKPYRKIVAKATEKVQGKRYQSAGDMKADIESLQFRDPSFSVTSGTSNEGLIEKIGDYSKVLKIALCVIAIIILSILGILIFNKVEMKETENKESENTEIVQKLTLSEYLKMLDSPELTNVQIAEIEKAVEEHEWTDSEDYQQVKKHIQAIKHIQIRCIQSENHRIADLRQLTLLYSGTLSESQEETLNWILSQDVQIQNLWENETHGFQNLASVKEYFTTKLKQ